MSFKYHDQTIAGLPDLDTTPTQNSVNAITSGGVYSALAAKKTVMSITAQEYSLLSQAEKMADIVYVITDDEAPTDTVYSKTQVDSLISNVIAQEVIRVEIASYDGTTTRIPSSGTNPLITADHVVISSTLGTPSVQTGDWTVTTYAGYLTLSGNASGSTSVRLILGKAGTVI